MKIIIAYPPLDTQKGFPTLGQNRQFQYFSEPTYIYPIVPAQAATMLKQAGHEVIWLDCTAEGLRWEEFRKIIAEEKPDLIACETKTPVIKQIWKIVDELKAEFPGLKCVLFGDHVTALPKESFDNSKTDFVLTGGDYDFLLLNLCNALQRQGPFNPVDLEPGIWYAGMQGIKNTGVFKLNHDLDTLPIIDRDLTKWRLYAYKNGNYKRTPGTYIMSGRDCWWGRCTFCSWPALYPEYRSRGVANVLDEAGFLIDNYAVREIMDDAGSFPAGDWLRQFCSGFISRGFNRKIYFDCNMRFGALGEEEFSLMKQANFRLLLFGLESANQETLDRLNKNLKVERIIQDCKLARKAGLFPHITIMFGYPWETYEQALNTLRLGKWLLNKGLAYTMQATIVIPYPGSALFQESKDKGWLKSLDWNDYDMKSEVMNTSIPFEKIMCLVQSMYKSTLNPQFFLRKIFSLRDTDDLKYFLRAAKKLWGHVFDFRKTKTSCLNFFA